MLNTTTKTKTAADEMKARRLAVVALMAKRSRMEFDEETVGDAGSLCWSMRDEGDMETDSPGEGDIIHARAMRDAIRVLDAGAIVKIECVDEWTTLRVSFPEGK